MLTISETVWDTDSYNEVLTGTYTCPSQGCHFEWPWATLSDLAKYSVTQSIMRQISFLFLYVLKVVLEHQQNPNLWGVPILFTVCQFFCCSQWAYFWFRLIINEILYVLLVIIILVVCCSFVYTVLCINCRNGLWHAGQSGSSVWSLFFILSCDYLLLLRHISAYLFR